MSKTKIAGLLIILVAVIHAAALYLQGQAIDYAGVVQEISVGAAIIFGRDAIQKAIDSGSATK